MDPISSIFVALFRHLEASLASSIGLLGLATAMLVAVRLQSKGAGLDDAVQRMLRLAGHILMAVGLLGVIGILAGGLAALTALLTIITYFELSMNRRREERVALARVLAWTTRRQLPLAPMIAAYAHEQPRDFQATTLALADRLASGLPLEEALRPARRLLPPQARTALQLGQHLGDAVGPLDEAAAMDRELDSIWSSIGGRLLPLMLIALTFPTLLFFILYRITPAIAKIAADFRLESTIHQKWVTLIGSPILSAGFVLLLLCLWGYFIWCTLFYIGWMTWRPPGARSVLRQAEQTLVLRWLSLAIGSQRPLAPAIEVLSRDFPSDNMRYRMLRLLQDLHLGQTLSEALYRAGLIRRADRPVIDTATRAGNLAWALRAVADSNWRRYTFRLQAVLQVVFSLAILAVGVVALLTGVGIIGPIVELIQVLS